MTQSPSSAVWAAERGEQWRDHYVDMEATLAPLDDPLVAALRLDSPCRIAEVGCGGGGTTLEIQRQAPAGSVVHGFDISPALVAAARTRVQTADAGPSFRVADVATATPPGEPYDRLVSRLGVMFFDDPAAAFANLTRWLAPGGRFVFAVWAASDKNPWMTTSREVILEVVDLPDPDPAAPGPFRYAEPESLLALLAGAGLIELRVETWAGRIPVGGGVPASQAAQFALTAFSVPENLSKAGPQALAAVRRSLTARYAAHERGGVVEVGACVHLITGTRPGGASEETGL